MSAGQDATTAGPVVESVELHVAAGAEAAFEAAVAEAEPLFRDGARRPSHCPDRWRTRRATGC